MDIKSEMEIKEEPLECLEGVTNNSQRFKQDSCLERVKKEVIYTFTGIKEESLSFEEEYSETDQHTEQISQLQESQSQNCDGGHGENEVRVKVESPSRNPLRSSGKIIFKNNEEDELKLQLKSDASSKKVTKDASPQAKLITRLKYLSRSKNVNTKISTIRRAAATALLNRTFKNVCIRTQKEKKPIKCSNCDKAFKCKSDLEIHNRTHTGEKPFKCSYCEKNFRQKFSLVVHSRIHTGEKPFKCSYCDKSFSDKNRLIPHLRTHTGEKPFKCSYCDKSFNQKISLEVHTRVHTGERPLKCSYCSKSYKDRSGLRYHLRTHTDKASTS